MKPGSRAGQGLRKSPAVHFEAVAEVGEEDGGVCGRGAGARLMAWKR